MLIINCETNDGYLLEMIYQGCIGDEPDENIFGSKLSIKPHLTAISSFLLSIDCFTIGEPHDDNTVYFSSSVKSIEKAFERTMMPEIKKLNMKQ